ncbi:exodeoxyribonuclease III [Candidatus Kinetoplastidibacterium crithidiae]|uniref:Exodeoxyribonuclease III n=1 Tax=Candidatus Kinetoplastidibacterium crithidiae TCC036E TaxID=1208918 RepID=M1LTY3_9PROT|nr:exodeoxyribonuclease III [Candidatus Kinetoplastibacterium crithidii]AFZ82777.1 exodeoxyribonuclease III [Candidatus Kinetoplastibacterium crithidii (ex Angomonas deanei ATCC 30255)]AGF47571.1 exodeoxyribonuclease III [Candidatus Kinetoplastibacterium crithidii TCC036E]
MNIATWNVNSLKIRFNQVLDFLVKNNIDILCLQETKLIDDNFPHEEFNRLGYQSYCYGQKTYNGVAIISKYKAIEVSYGIKNYIDEQKRVISITVNVNNFDLRIICIYCPNGQSLESDKFRYKMEWFYHLNTFIYNELENHKNLILLGDYNIAPSDDDVYDTNIWQNTILVSKDERTAFTNLINLGLNDLFNKFDQPKKSFTWWDYRNYSFLKNNGLRIDHILASNSVQSVCESFNIDIEMRKKERPSDHAPVSIRIKTI